MKKLLAIILSLSFLLCAVTGCGQNKPAETPADDEPYKIGILDYSVMGGTTAIAYMNCLYDMCETAGVELLTTPLNGYDDASFMAAYELLVSQGADSVIVTTFSEGAIPLIADMCEAEGVEWFLANRQVINPELKDRLFAMDTMVGNTNCNEAEVAYDMVRQLSEDFGVKNLAVIGLTLGDVNGDLRDSGIARACEDFSVNLLTETRGINSVDDVSNAVESIIASYPEMDGIFIVGGGITTGALAGASQALENNGLSDKVSIAMIDTSRGMGDYMGEGKPLKLVAGGNCIMDFVFSCACLINNYQGINADETPYIINTNMLYINDAQEANDFDEYCEHATIPVISGDQWNELMLGKSVAEIQNFSNEFSVEFAKNLRG